MTSHDWISTATETRTCFPYRSLEDLGLQPQVEWMLLDTSTDQWIPIEGSEVLGAPLPATKACRAYLRFPEGLEDAITDHLPGVAMKAALIAASSSSRNRQVQAAVFGRDAEIKVELDTRTWRGSVGLSVVVYVDPDAESNDGEHLPGAQVWRGGGPTIVLDQGAPPPGQGFDVQWSTILADGVLYQLDTPDGYDLPTRLLLNGKDHRVAEIWKSAGTRGVPARMRDVLDALVTADVFSQLAAHASAIEEESGTSDELQFKEAVGRTLRKRFDLGPSKYTDVHESRTKYMELNSAIQGAKRVDLHGKLIKLIAEIDK